MQCMQCMQCASTQEPDPRSCMVTSFTYAPCVMSCHGSPHAIGARTTHAWAPSTKHLANEPRQREPSAAIVQHAPLALRLAERVTRPAAAHAAHDVRLESRGLVDVKRVRRVVTRVVTCVVMRVVTRVVTRVVRRHALAGGDPLGGRGSGGGRLACAGHTDGGAHRLALGGAHRLAVGGAHRHALDDVEGERDDAEDDVAREARVEAEHLLQHAQPEAGAAQRRHEGEQLRDERDAVGRAPEQVQLLVKVAAVADGLASEEGERVRVGLEAARMKPRAQPEEHVARV
mmetsp:Transcript_63250/g.167319  ORF Transcript_63250/g.167319 Transcript_63250/m.167319 type:complete len:287 (-) Transcript_63250:168-1028(-)